MALHLLPGYQLQAMHIAILQQLHLSRSAFRSITCPSEEGPGTYLEYRHIEAARDGV